MSTFWRVYRTEWAVAYVSDVDGKAGRVECEGRGGKDHEWRAVPWSKSNPEGWPWVLEVRRPVLKGEYRDVGDAAKHAAEIGGQAVLEGSPEDKAIRRQIS